MAEAAKREDNAKKQKKFVNLAHMKSKFNGVVVGSDAVFDKSQPNSEV